MNKTVHLVVPRSTRTSGQRTFHDYGWVPPVRLEYLARSLEIAGIETRIFDLNREAVSEDELFRCDAFGVSVWHDQYPHGLELLREAKQRGLRTLIGGAQTKGREAAIAARHPYIDHVVSGYADRVIADLVLGRVSDRIVRNIGNVPARDDIHLGHVQHDLAGLHMDAFTYIPLATMRGCEKASGKGACLFCSENEERPARVTAESFWRQIRSLNRQYGIRQYFETGSTFPTQPRFLQSLVEEKPSGLDVSLKVYSRVESLHPEQIELFSRIGVSAVFVGIENIGSSVLRVLGKTSDLPHIETVIRLLAEHGIDAYLSFVHRIPGDTMENVRRNIAFSERLVRFQGVRVGHPALIPVPGSASFRMIEQDAALQMAYRQVAGRNLASDDDPDLSVLSRLFVERYTSLDMQALTSELEAFRQRSLANGRGTFLFLE